MRPFLASLFLAVSGSVCAQTVVVDSADEFIQAVLDSAEVIEVEAAITFDQPYQDTENALPLFGVTNEAPTTVRGRPGAQLVAGQDGFRLASIENHLLRLKNLTIKDFSSPGDGGVVRVGSAGGLVVDNVTFYNNHSAQQGGAIFALQGQAVVMNSKFENNSADLQGGALYFNGVVFSNVNQSQFKNNQASAGCAVYSRSAFVEFNGNLFRGDCPQAKLRVDRASLVQNSFVLCRGEAYASSDSGNVTLYGNLFTDLEGDTAPPLCRIGGDVNSLGANLAGDASCGLNAATDQIGFEVADTLNLFGLPVPAVGGAAVDIIEVPVVSSDDVRCELTDVSGLGRPQDGNGDGVFACDIGALEKQGGPDIGAAMTGAYFDPARSGEGYFVEMLNDERAWVTFFTYSFAEDPPSWLFGLGDVVGNSIVVEAFFTASGGRFGEAYNPEDFEQFPLAGVSLVFPNCESQAEPGRAFFRSFDPFFNVPVQPEDLLTKTVRLSQVLNCNGEPASAKSGLSGSFYDPVRAGEGIIVEWLDETRPAPVLAVWYTFDLEGNQLWLISDEATVVGDTVTLSMAYPAGTTGFGSNFDPDEVDLEPWGTVTLDYNSCNEINFSFESVVDGFGSGAYTYQRLTQPAGTQCTL